MASSELKLFDSKGQQVGTAQASASVFGAKLSKGVIHEVVRWQRAKKRAGTHSTKTRAEMSGGGKKPWKQKGTGKARSGSNTSPIWVGGGVAHGPKPRSYEFSLNRKQRKLALCGALSARVKDEKCLVVQDFGFTEAKTKQAVNLLSSIGLRKGAKVAVIVTDGDLIGKQSFRNIPKVTALEVSGVNVYDIAASEYVLMSEAALAGIETRLGKEVAIKAAE